MRALLSTVNPRDVQPVRASALELRLASDGAAAARRLVHERGERRMAS